MNSKAGFFMHSVLLIFASLFIFGISAPAFAQESKGGTKTCAATDKSCLMQEIEALTPSIEKQEWQDQTYRELAKAYSYEGETDKAIALIGKIQTPDTKAMTIRGIGMAAASLKWDAARYTQLFAALTEEAKKITHAPSQGIAYTYIAMAQAFAGDNDGAHATAKAMTNQALRNKAFAESAEIQAERGDIDHAMKSLDSVDTQSFRNKAYDTVSKIFLDRGNVDAAYACAVKIDNAYLKAKSIQRILNKDNAEEADMEPVGDAGKME